MSAADTVQMLTEDPNRAVTPTLSDYDAHSEGWSETEFQVETGPSTVAGRWVGEPGWVEFDSWPYREFCVIVSGRVAVESATAHSASNTAPETRSPSRRASPAGGSRSNRPGRSSSASPSEPAGTRQPPLTPSIIV